MPPCDLWTSLLSLRLGTYQRTLPPMLPSTQTTPSPTHPDPPAEEVALACQSFHFTPSFEFHAVSVTYSVKLNIVVLYCPPLGEFLEELHALLSDIPEDGPLLVLLCDFNIQTEKRHITFTIFFCFLPLSLSPLTKLVSNLTLSLLCCNLLWTMWVPSSLGRLIRPIQPHGCLTGAPFGQLKENGGNPSALRTSLPINLLSLPSLASLSAPKTPFFQSKIQSSFSKSPNNSFPSSLPSLIARLPTSLLLSTDFVNYFVKKMAYASHFPTRLTPHLTSFSPLSPNEVIATGCFLKAARVIPLLKKTPLNPSYIKNYRPVSLLPFFF